MTGGRLVVETMDGDVHEGRSDLRNLFLQYAPAADFDVTTRVAVKPEQDYEQAGLYLWQDHNHFVKLAVVYAGQIRELGSAEAVLGDPQDPYTQALLASIPSLHAQQAPAFLRGAPPDLRMTMPGCRFQPRCPHAFEPCDRAEPPLVEAHPGQWARCWLHRSSLCQYSSAQLDPSLARHAVNPSLEARRRHPCLRRSRKGKGRPVRWKQVGVTLNISQRLGFRPVPRPGSVGTGLLRRDPCQGSGQPRSSEPFPASCLSVPSVATALQCTRLDSATRSCSPGSHC